MRTGENPQNGSVSASFVEIASTLPQHATLLSKVWPLFYHLYSKPRGQYDCGRADSMRGMQPPKRLCVQESLNFINRSKYKEEYGCKDDSVTAG